MRELARYFLAAGSGAHEDVGGEAHEDAGSEAHEDVGTLGIPRERADVYRRLVRANLSVVISNAFPVARAIYGPRLDAELITPFLAAGGPSTSYYRQVPGDVVRWAVRAEHPHAELLHYEWLELVAARHPADVDAWHAAPRPGAASPVDLNPTLQLAVYTRPVHLISADTPSPEPLATPSAYAVWRRPRSDAVVFHRLGLVLGRVLEHALTTPQPLDTLVRAVAAESGLDAAVIAPALAAVVRELAGREGARG
jgi:hypothetical protein